MNDTAIIRKFSIIDYLIERNNRKNLEETVLTFVCHRKSKQNSRVTFTAENVM